MPEADASHRELRPSSKWVERFLPSIPRTGRVLDVACGSGRHLRLALERGYEVTGVDRNLSGVADLEGTPGVELVAADLEDGRPFPFRGRSFAGVIVTNYLWRPILPDIVACVAPDGLLIYETFAVGNERYGRVKNPEFLLKPGELIEAVRGRLVPIAFEHGKLADPERVVQRIAAVGPNHVWLRDPPEIQNALRYNN
ncbi:MAG: SAM-dependent methyltransferase [Proteobacteria bacterium]|nr:MAG: SAM-dependent methyltransferase [Pseudomonadota bacterium]